MIKETQNFFSLLGLTKNPFQKNGVLKQKYNNGKLKILGIVKEGYREGMWKFYYKNGELRYDGKWDEVGIDTNGDWEPDSYFAYSDTKE